MNVNEQGRILAKERKCWWNEGISFQLHCWLYASRNKELYVHVCLLSFKDTTVARFSTLRDLDCYHNSATLIAFCWGTCSFSNFEWKSTLNSKLSFLLCAKTSVNTSSFLVKLAAMLSHHQRDLQPKRQLLLPYESTT